MSDVPVKNSNRPYVHSRASRHSSLSQRGIHGTPLIALGGVSKTYGGQDGAAATVALADVSLAIEAGEFVCLTGPSGSGKSTLLNVIGCLTRPSAGWVRIDGRDVSDCDGEQLAALRRDVFGFVFQRANLLDETTAIANVELPALYRGTSARERRRRALELLASLGLAEEAARRAGDLSGGQRQRVGIGRALMNGARVILADEPTAGLDRSQGGEVMALLSDLAARGHTVIVATHDPQAAASAMRQVELRDGRLARDAGTATRSGAATPAPLRTRVAPWAPAAAAWRQGWAGLRRNPLRAALTALGVAVGVWSVTSTLSLAAGAYDESMALFGRLGPELIDVGPGFDFERMAQAITLTRGDAAAIRELANVRTATVEKPMSILTIQRADAEQLVNTSCRADATLPHAFLKEYAVAEGRYLTVRDDRERAAVVVLAASVRESLFSRAADPIGESVLIGGKPFTVVGVFAPHPLAVRHLRHSEDVEWANTAVWMPASICEEWRPLGNEGIGFTGITVRVRVRDPIRTEETAQAIRDLLVRRHGPDAAVAVVAVDAIGSRAYFESVRNKTAMLAGLGITILLAAGLAIMAVALAAVNQRRREIALRMAVGARRSDIARQFLAESLATGLFGAVVGVSAGAATAVAVEALNTPAAFDPRVLAAGGGCGVAVSLLFGILPARRAAAVDAVQALATD